jgi:ribose transport system substrate-binding protein
MSSTINKQGAVTMDQFEKEKSSTKDQADSKVNSKSVEDFIEKIHTVNIDRRHFLKYVGAVAGATALGSILTACGVGNGPAAVTPSGTSTTLPGPALVAKKGSPIVSLVTSLDNEYFKAWNQGAEQAIQALDMKFETYYDENSVQTQISRFETKASSGVKMIFLTAPDASNIVTLSQIANQNKTYFVNVWNMPDWTTPLELGDYFVSFFTPNSIQNGYDMAKVLFKEMGGKGNFVQISGFPGATPNWQRTLGMEMAMKEFPDIKMIASQSGKWLQTESRKVAQNIITANPGKVDGIFGQNDSSGIGAMHAAEELGLKIPITGIDGSKEAMELIKAGRFTGSSTPFPFWHGGYSAVRVFDAFNGWKPTAPERMMYTGGAIITKDNVNSYYDKYYGSSTVPLDWKLMSRVLHPDDWDPQNLLWPMDPDEFWQGRPKPAGYQYPPALKASKDNGEFDKIKKLYEDHYKKKML